MAKPKDKRAMVKQKFTKLHELYLQSKSVDVVAYQNFRTKTKIKTLLRYETIRDQFFAGNENRLVDAVTNYNHRIKQIITLDQTIDVYDIEVPQTHNFALSSGIFVHNSAKQGRDRKFQAILPLRGKVLNTERAQLDKIIGFEELKFLTIALGMGIGDVSNPEKLRYHRVIIMTDADVDGAHIACLLMTFFYRHLPYIVEHGHLYVAMPPLYKIDVAKTSTYIYTDLEKDTLLAKYPNQKFSIQRYKGLGEMNPDQLWETTMNPQNRILKRVDIADAAHADHVFSTLMGNEVPPRKKFITTHAKTATLDI